MSKMMPQEAERPITAGFFNRDAFRKKEQMILVLKTGIAGIDHHVDTSTDEGQELLKRLVPGTELKLYRDPDNEHDKWAISVYTVEDDELGYISRFKNETIARLMDYGRKFKAFVDEPPPEPADATEYRRTRAWSEDYRLPFSVYMVEGE